MTLKDDIKDLTKEDIKYLVWTTIRILAFTVLMIVVGYKISYSNAINSANEFICDSCYNEFGQKYCYQETESKIINTFKIDIGNLNETT